MRPISALIENLCVVPERPFVAPCVRGGNVRVRLDGLVGTYGVEPPGFEGWGVFKALDCDTAVLLERASPHVVERWLRAHPRVRVVLARRLRGQAWLAWPADAEVFARGVGPPRPLTVQLVTDAAPMQTAWVRWDGAHFWFEAVDLGVDPRLAEALRAALRDRVAPRDLRISGLTPEQRCAYGIEPRATPRRRAERRLRSALEVGGGRLADFVDRDDHWVVTWLDADGERQVSAVDTHDLTVVSAGICLDDRDRDFDLQSLVGVFADPQRDR